MSFFELMLLAISLSMDALAAALCQGLSMQKVKIGRAALTALFFGGFQALMPLVGGYLGEWFSAYIAKWTPYIAFAILVFIGGRTIYEAIKRDGCEAPGQLAGIGQLFLLAIATSIDALAVGITLPALWKQSIYLAALVIGCTTFLLSFAGVWLGNKFGTRFRKKAEIFGGGVLIALGIKILIEHLLG
ncbi:MAG: manganese efflux pump MntP family protein [Clostridia bacterium]|nr:manganese efflux pump MntP family protein [Clostridia bacterium]